MTYPQAQDIARYLSARKTKAARLLRQMCEKTGRYPTFIIMRYGDPREWKCLPEPRDNRMKAKRLPSFRVARQIVAEVTKAGGQVAKALKRRAKHMAKLRYKHPMEAVVMRDGDPRQWPEIVRNLKTKTQRRMFSIARACTLQHVDGRIVTARSIVQFCEKAGLTKSDDRYHVTPVLDGKRHSFKDWYLPETLARVVKLRDVYGNETEKTVLELLRGGKMGKTSIFRLLDGQMKSAMHNRVKMADTPHDSPLSPRPVKVIKVTLTDGQKTYSGSSVLGAARKAGVTNLPGLYSAAYGFKDEVQGMRIKELELVKRRVDV